MDFLALLVFILALAGSIFIHELGHFIAARMAKIEVEEFGFGLPPRAFGFWQNKGYFVLNSERVEIPANFDLKLDWNILQREFISISADKVEDKLILRSLKYADAQQTPHKNVLDSQEIWVDQDGKSVAPDKKSSSKTLVFGKAQGAIQMEGHFSEAHPGTLFSINWLPLGGFVRPHGENDPNVPDGLSAANPWKRLGVLFAGPIMNLLTAVVVFAIIIGLSGVAIPGSISILDVEADSPAAEAGFVAGDVIRAVNGIAVEDVTEARQQIYENFDKTIPILIERNGVQQTLSAMPLSTRPANKGALGIVMDTPRRPATASEVIIGGFTMTGLQAVGILSIPVLLIQNAIEPELARPIGLVGMFGAFSQAVERDTQTRQEAAAASSAGEPAPLPTNYTLLLLASLSVSLGVFNLLPIPALDGGRIAFTLPEILFRRRVPYRFENVVNGVAFLVLIGLMIFINVMDFINPANFQLP